MDQLKLKTVKIRKPHRCWGCTKRFSKGSKMTYSVCVDQGEFNSSYWCSECNELMGSLEDWQREDGFSFGELLNYKDE